MRSTVILVLILLPGAYGQASDYDVVRAWEADRLDEARSAAASGNLSIFGSILLTDDYEKRYRRIQPEQSEARFQRNWRFLRARAAIEASKYRSVEMNDLLAR